MTGIAELESLKEGGIARKVLKRGLSPHLHMAR